MSAIQRVLFPIDLSLDYRALSATTRKMFDRPGVEIVMLHVIEEPSRSVRGMEVARSMAQMEFLARKEFAFARSSRRVERGRPADSILDYARNTGVDVIVMPAGSPESIRRGTLGHVTEEVMTRASCDMWMEWMAGPGESAQHICCAVGLDVSDEAVVCRAAEVAGEFSADLTILHAVVPESPMLLWWDADAFEQELRIARMRVDELRDRSAPAARVHVEAGRPDGVISQALYRLDAGLLVAAGQGEAIAAVAAGCPVLRLAARQPMLARECQMERGSAFAATEVA
jgi:nucleotide-binding universal stress UspA family protein